MFGHATPRYATALKVPSNPTNETHMLHFNSIVVNLTVCANDITILFLSGFHLRFPFLRTVKRPPRHSTTTTIDGVGHARRHGLAKYAPRPSLPPSPSSAVCPFHTILSLNVFSPSALDFPWDMHRSFHPGLGHSLEFRVPNISHRAGNVI